MKTKYLFDPLSLFLIPSVYAVLLWILTPDEWFNDWKILYKVDAQHVLVPWVVAFIAFLIGSWLRRLTYTAAAQRLPQDIQSAKKTQWAGFLIASASMLILVVLVVQDFGLMGLIETYTVRGSYIGGLTTFSLLTNAGLILAGVYFLVDRNTSRIALIPLLGMGAYALYRGFVGAERIAILVPFVAVGSVYMLMRFERITARMCLLAVIGFITVLGLFIGAEYFRSFEAKLAYGENINTNIIEYGWQRFVLYFSTSVNSGGTLFSFFRDDMSYSPLFERTFSPLAKIMYNMLNLPPVVFGPYEGDSSNVAVSMGLFNPEFNNNWGVATPFTEGWIPGILFWIIWGYLGTHLYLNVTKRRGDAWDWALFGLFVAAFVDNQSRVALLAAPHFLVPFIWLYAAFWSWKAFGSQGKFMPANHPRTGQKSRGPRFV